VLAALALGACAGPTGDVAGPVPAAAAGACGAAVAAHVGKPAGAVVASWDRATPDGGGTVTVTDAAAGAGERTHVCTVDAGGAVRTVTHATP